MDTKQFVGLMEAYSEVYSPQREFELWVNELVEEGYDLSEYTWDEMYDIYEAEGSYGATPKAREAMRKVYVARSEKPASEYSQKGEKTRKVKGIEKHIRRIDDGPDAGNRGKRSTSPRWSGYRGVTGRGKMSQDARDSARERDVEYSAGENKPGSGTVTKNPKKLRKQKAMGEIDESYDIFDVVLEFLQAEGFAETLEEAEWMMVNMIDEEAIGIILGEGVTIRDYKRKREMYKKSESGGKSSRVGLGPSGSEARVERGLEDTGSYKANERGIGGVTKNPKKLRKQKAIGELDEAQHARENPEKYEREQDKKYAPVRGERTPMPPRGNKRREDFEKWYAANVR